MRDRKQHWQVAARRVDQWGGEGGHG
jgi:hypothetical protein